jgi:hypothetical protein
MLLYLMAVSAIDYTDFNLSALSTVIPQDTTKTDFFIFNYTVSTTRQDGEGDRGGESSMVGRRGGGK